MASACVNNIGMTPENFLDCPATTYPSYGWLSPRISFSREMTDDDSSSKVAGPKPPSPVKNPRDLPETSDPEALAGDFEFRLEDPVAMLPADQLFSDGKLVPLQLSAIKPSVNALSLSEMRSTETAKSRLRPEISCTDPYLFSPKAPRCSSRWKELLGLKKLYQSTNSKNETHKTTPSSSSSVNPNHNPKSLRHFLHRSSKSSSSSADTSLSLPLLKDSDSESVSISSRLSLSSSSSGHEHEDLSRLSLDSDKPTPPNPNPNPSVKNQNPNAPRMRLVKPRPDNPTAARVGRSPIRRAPAESSAAATGGVSIDSPRMNSSGKIVFQSLERSSSSPSSFNGGPRFKHRGMERSYSANVRITPVLNVPVCSLRGSSKSASVFGFGQLFSSPQKREGTGNGGCSSRGQQSNSRNRTERT